MTWRKTIILGLVFLCAAAGYLVDRALTGKKKIIKEERQKLFNLSPEAVSAFTLENRSGRYRLEKKEGAWQIVEPRKLPADEGQVESLLTNLVLAKKYHPIKTGERVQYGLDNPTASIALEEKVSGGKQTLLVGVESTTTGRYFAAFKGGDAVFTIAGHIRNFLDKNLYHLRDKTVLTVSAEDIRAIKVEGSGRSLSLEKDKQGGWRLLEPGPDRADGGMVKNLLSELAALKASSFEEDTATTPGSYGLDDPLFTLSVTADESYTLFIGKKDVPREQNFARREYDEQVITLPARFIRLLSGDPNEYRSREIFRIEPGDIREIKIIVGASFVSVQREEGGTWRFQSRPDLRVHQGRVKSLLSSVSSLRIDTFEDANPDSLKHYGLDVPRARVIIYSGDREEKEILSFGKKAEDRDICFARVSTRPFIFGIDWTLVGGFYLTRQDLEDRRLFPVNQEKIHRVTFQTGDIEGALERKKGKWVVEGKEAQVLRVVGILSGIINLEFVREISESETTEFDQAMDSPEIRMVLDGEGDEILGGFSAVKGEGPEYILRTRSGKHYLVSPDEIEDLRESLEDLVRE